MSTFDSTKLPLTQVIKDIKNGDYQLPDFQRGWVWDDEHVRSLLVSIARSFPVGAVMTLATGGDVNFQVRPVENVIIDDDKEPDTLILDGQQRLTSLTQVLGLKGPVKTYDHKKHKIERYYYVDIKKILNGEDFDDAFYSVGKDKRITSDFGRKVELDISTTEKEVEQLQFPCNQIFDHDDWQHECYKVNKYEEFRDFKKAVLDPFNDYDIPVIALNKATTKEAVCIVFEKVNTGGVSLTAFELITASFAAEGYNLREDWYGKSNSDDEGRLARLKKDNLLAGVQPTDYIQAITLLHTYELNQKVRLEGKKEGLVPGISCKRKAMLNLQLKDYKNWADRLESAFSLVGKFLRKECFISKRDIPYRTQLVPLAAIMAHLGDRWLEPKINDRLSKWFWCGVMGELYGSAIENRFANDIEDFLIWIEDETKEPRTVFDASFSPSRLETLRTRNSAAYKGLNVLALRNGAKDFFWKAGVQELDAMGESLDIHHLFPKKWCESKGISKNTFDSVVNKTPISFKANRKIGGDAPSKYLYKIQNDDQVGLSDIEMDRILDSHLIDPGLFRNDSFNQFMHLRSIRLVNIIYEAMGKMDSLPDGIALFNYGSEKQAQESLSNKLSSGESSIVEFKSTMRWNINADMQDKKMEDIILKSIAAFNNRYGGTLMIGVNDQGEVLGLEKDYQTFREHNKDHFELHLRNLINDRYGKDFATSQVIIDFPVIDDKEFCQIEIMRGKVPKYLIVDVKNGPKVEKFYVRSGNTSQELSIQEAAEYIRERFPSI